MKKILIGLLVIIVLIVGALVAFVMTFDVEKYRPQIEAQATNAIGRKISFGGPISMSLWPSLAIQVQDVRVANPTWTEKRSMLTAGTIDFSIAIMPLLQRKIAIERVFLDNIELSLEESAKGEKNWLLPIFDQTGKPATPEPAPVLEEDGTKAPPLSLDVSQITLSNVRFSHRLGRANDTPVVHELLLNRVTVRAPENQRVGLDATGVFAGEEFNIGLRAGTLAELQAKTPFQVALTVTAVDSDMEVQGTVDMSGPLKADVNLAMQGSRFADLSRIIVNNPPLPEGEPYRLVSRLQVAPNEYQLSGLVLEFGESRFNGNFKLVMEDERPKLVGNIVSEVLNLGDFAIATDETAADEETAPAAAGTAAAAPAALPWQALETADADVTFDFRNLTSVNAALGSVNGRVDLSGGRLVIEPLVANLAGGTLNAQIIAESIGQFALSLNGEQIRWGETLEALGVSKALEGVTNVKANVQGRGRQVEQLQRSLQGVIEIDGGKGFLNLDRLDNKWVNSIRQASPFTINTERTVMNCAVSTVTISQGVATIADTFIDTAALSIAATGRYDVPPADLNMVVRARLNTGATSGVSAPLKVTGTPGDLSIAVDPQGLAQGLGDIVGVNLGGFRVPVVTDNDGGAQACRTAIKQAASQPAGSPRQAIQDAITKGGSSDAVKEQLDKLPEGAGNAVRSLFDRFGN